MEKMERSSKSVITVPLKSLIDEFHLEISYMPDDPSNIFIFKPEIDRPALPLAGFYDCFDSQRIQILGNTECKYLESLEPDVQEERISALMSKDSACIIYTHGNKVNEIAEFQAAKYKIPLMSTDESTGTFVANLLSYLQVVLAPRITRHGELVEVYGEGILILGDSGVGKSETAIELIKRGHRLIADDAVEISKVSSRTIVGQAPEIIRHYVELRGIGIIDIRRLFGMGAVKSTEKIDMVIKLEHWIQGKDYDRYGLEDEYIDIMGIKVPKTTIPVRPGRNLAVIIEIAAMNNRQKKMGYNTAQEFNKKLMGDSQINVL